MLVVSVVVAVASPVHLRMRRRRTLSSEIWLSTSSGRWSAVASVRMVSIGPYAIAVVVASLLPSSTAAPVSLWLVVVPAVGVEAIHRASLASRQK